MGNIDSEPPIAMIVKKKKAFLGSGLGWSCALRVWDGAGRCRRDDSRLLGFPTVLPTQQSVVIKPRVHVVIACREYLDVGSRRLPRLARLSLLRRRLLSATMTIRALPAELLILLKFVLLHAPNCSA